jgi:tetratricopeptide (TPR) repeat protein
MSFTLDLHRRSTRIAFSVIALAAYGLFIAAAIARFVISVAVDPQIQVSQETIEAAVAYFPDSAHLQARLATRLLESGVDGAESHERMAQRTIHHATRAVSLAPWSFEARVLLSAARELNGELIPAEKELRQAIALAPHRVDLHWRLANLLVRQDRLAEALDEFRAVLSTDPARLPATLDTVWQASGNDLDAMRSVTGSQPRAQMALANFLAAQERQDLAEAAAGIFTGLDPRSLQTLPETTGLLDSMIAAGRIELANRLWRHLFGEPPNRSLIWNGGFESPRRKGFTQFDWQLGESKYARIGVVTGVSRTGQRSLGLVYRGVETTRLEDEIGQLIAARPGTHYRLECYAKTDALITPDGPRIVVTNADSPNPIASTNAVAQGTHGWRLLAIDFIAPPDTRALRVCIRQTPSYSYADPTLGAVWFDDFSLTEIQSR